MDNPIEFRLRNVLAGTLCAPNGKLNFVVVCIKGVDRDCLVSRGVPLLDCETFTCLVNAVIGNLIRDDAGGSAPYNCPRSVSGKACQLNRSTQHFVDVYWREFEILRFLQSRGSRGTTSQMIETVPRRQALVKRLWLAR